MLKAARWGDNDRYFGPFTWSYGSSYRPYAIVLRSSGGGDDDDGPCTLRLTIGPATIIAVLPSIIRPHRTKVYPREAWDAATVARIGRDFYWDVDPRQYGISVSDGFLQVFYGRTGGSTMDSRVQQQWSCFLPWTQWRHVRHSLYGLKGEHVWSEPKGCSWEARREAEAACPTVAFRIADFDDQEIVVTTRIEEREWHFGTGWFKWLRWFRSRRISRSLDLDFASECGPEKGSWKGGLMGTSIEMRPGELHEAAFRRYCEEEHRSKYRKYKVRFLGAAAPLTTNPTE